MSQRRDASQALGRPKYPPPRVPKKVAVEITGRNRTILICLIQHLSRRLVELEADPEQYAVRHNIALARVAIGALDLLLVSNPKVLILDPKDVIANIIVFTLDSVCANVIEVLEHAPLCMDCTMAATSNAGTLGTPMPPPPYFDYGSQTWQAYSVAPPSMYWSRAYATHDPRSSPGSSHGVGGRYVNGRRAR